MNNSTQWLVALNKLQAQHNAQIIFFPYAGGHAHSYSRLAKQFSFARCLGVELPGKGGRMNEAPSTNITDVVSSLSKAIADTWDENTIFFGHSMGSLLAFECAKKLEKCGKQLKALITSGQCAPRHHAHTHYFDYRNNDETLLKQLKELGGVNEVVLDNPEMRTLILETVRADARLIASYDYQSEHPLSCPIAYIQAEDDLLITSEHANDWFFETKNQYHLQKISGGHFALFEETTELTPLLSSFL